MEPQYFRCCLFTKALWVPRTSLAEGPYLPVSPPGSMSRETALRPAGAGVRESLGRLVASALAGAVSSGQTAVREPW